MAKEILELEVKATLKGAVTDVDALGTSVQTTAERYAELNENVAVQNEYIATQETELIRLKEIQDSIPKGAWHAGQHVLADNIREVTSEIRSEKDALKALKKEQKEVASAIRDKTSAQKKDTNAAIRGIQHFRIMGVSIRSLKNMVRGVIPMFRLLFGTIRAGIMSTGIGVLILALISIGTAMSKSVAGGKALKAMLTHIGNVTKVITGTLTFLGDLMLSVFGFDSSAAVDTLAQSADKLKTAYDNLGKSMDDLNMKNARNATKIRRNNKLIEDTTLTEKQRLVAAEDNYNLEYNSLKENQALMEENIKLKEQDIIQSLQAYTAAVRNEESVDGLMEKTKAFEKEKAALKLKAQNLRNKERQDLDDFNELQDNIRQYQIDQDKKAQDKADKAREKRKQKREADAKEVAQAETTLARQLQKIKDELQYESLATQTEVEKAKLKNTYDRAKLEIQNSKASQETKDAVLIELLNKYNGDVLEITEKSDTLLAELRQENALLAIDDERTLADTKLEIQRKAELDSVEGMENSELLKTQIKAKYSKIQGKINAKRGKDDKAISDASTNDQIAAFGNLAGALSSLAGDNKELAAASAIIDTYVGANKAFAQGGLVGYVGAAAIIISGLANVKKIYAQDVPGDSGGGGGGTSAAPPAPEMMTGAFELGSGQEIEPMQAYVVSDDITESQNSLAIIRRRATI